MWLIIRLLVDRWVPAVHIDHRDLLLLVCMSLSIERKQPIVVDHSIQPSVGLCVSV